MSELGTTLAEGRAEAEARMTETVVAESVKITSGDDGEPVRTVTATWYTGIAQFKSDSTDVSEPKAGGAQFSTVEPMMKLPVGSPRVPVGAEFRVTASIVDDMLVGVVARVMGAPQMGQVTAHRYKVEVQQ